MIDVDTATAAELGRQVEEIRAELARRDIEQCELEGRRECSHRS